MAKKLFVFDLFYSTSLVVKTYPFKCLYSIVEFVVYFVPSPRMFIAYAKPLFKIYYLYDISITDNLRCF